MIGFWWRCTPVVPRAPRQPHTFPFAEAKSNVESESCSENARSRVGAKPLPEKSKHANDKGQASVAVERCNFGCGTGAGTPSSP
jgi:hypothetical protein